LQNNRDKFGFIYPMVINHRPAFGINPLAVAEPTPKVAHALIVRVNGLPGAVGARAVSAVNAVNADGAG